MQNELDQLVQAIKDNYLDHMKRGKEDTVLESHQLGMIETFNNNLEVTQGKKYFKIVNKRGGVWGFVVAVNNDAKFKLGDILKPAGFNAPTRNFARGNISGAYNAHWTGA